MRKLGTNTGGNNCVKVIDNCDTELIEVVDATIYGGIKEYVREFTQSDVTRGKINIAHNLDMSSAIAHLTLKDELGEECQPTGIKFKDNNIVELDLEGYVPITGTWTVRII